MHGIENNEAASRKPCLCFYGIPTRFSKFAEDVGRCLHFIDSCLLNWKEDGTIIVEGQEIAGSCITDIVHFMIAPTIRKIPIGFKAIANVLCKTNCPHSLLRNSSARGLVYCKCRIAL